MAKMFEVITINESVVIASIAGIESNANTKSVISTITRATSIGVAYKSLRPLLVFLRNKNLSLFNQMHYNQFPEDTI